MQSLAGSLLLVGTATAFAFLTTRWLSAADRGVVVVMLTASSLLMLVGSVGVSVGGRRLLTAEGGLSAAGYLRHARTLAAAHAVSASTLGVAVLWLSNGLPSVAVALTFIVFAVLSIYGYLVREFLHGLGRHRSAVFVEVVPAGAMLATVVVVHLWRPLSLQSVLAAVVIGGIAQFGYVTLATNRYRARSDEDPDLRRLIQASLPALGYILGSAVVVRGDRLILGGLAGPGAVGAYGLAATFSEILWIVPVLTAQFAFRRAALGSRIRGGWFLMMASTAAMAVPVTIVGRMLVARVFSPDYDKAADLLPLLVLAALPMASFHFDSAVLNGSGRFALVSAITYVGVALLIVTGVVLVSLLGANGAAIASLCAYTTMGVSARLAVIRTAR